MLKLFYILRRYKISQIFWKSYYLLKIKKFCSFSEIKTKYPKKNFNYFVNNSSTLLGNNFIKIFNQVFRDFETKFGFERKDTC